MTGVGEGLKVLGSSLGWRMLEGLGAFKVLCEFWGFRICGWFEECLDSSSKD